MADETGLSRRERQIMDVLFQTGEITAEEVRAQLPKPPSCTAVRTMLRILGEKGLVERRLEGRRYMYRPKRLTRVEGRSALERVLRVFFSGSLEQAVAAHLSDPKARPDAAEMQRLRDLIEQVDEQSRIPKRTARKGNKS